MSNILHDVSREMVGICDFLTVRGSQMRNGTAATCFAVRPFSVSPITSSRRVPMPKTSDACWSNLFFHDSDALMVDLLGPVSRAVVFNQRLSRCLAAFVVLSFLVASDKPLRGDTDSTTDASSKLDQPELQQPRNLLPAPAPPGRFNFKSAGAIAGPMPRPAARKPTPPHPPRTHSPVASP
jgi:hypothetical protein